MFYIPKLKDFDFTSFRREVPSEQFQTDIFPFSGRLQFAILPADYPKISSGSWYLHVESQMSSHVLNYTSSWQDIDPEKARQELEEEASRLISNSSRNFTLSGQSVTVPKCTVKQKI